ncbi:MAG TPA: nuclear transport factor 2 family protein [Bacteroidales bacterium]|mgnify:FL=1|nr:nuclear transport factor 2 family protein [Bacteroidales bacterium]
MTRLVMISVRIILLFAVLFLVTRVLKRADERSYGSTSTAVFSKGNAPDSIRKEVLEQLHKFQEGYTKRDTSQVKYFMNSLYSKDNLLVAGTRPREIDIGYEQAGELVKSDWESWGDCRFAMDSANISSSGNVTWFSARGFVKFDLSHLLVMPLRFTGVMVKEEGTWKFQKQQFQFDIDFSTLLPAILLLTAWLAVELVLFLIAFYRYFKKRSQA